MTILCEGCGKPLDADKDLCYTLVNNFTRKIEVICEKCYKLVFGFRREVNQLLREVQERHHMFKPPEPPKKKKDKDDANTV